MGRVMNASQHWEINRQQTTCLLHIACTIEDNQVTILLSNDDDVPLEQAGNVVRILGLSRSHSGRTINNFQRKWVISASLCHDVDEGNFLDGGTISHHAKSTGLAILLQAVVGFSKLGLVHVVEDVTTQLLPVTPTVHVMLHIIIIDHFLYRLFR